MQLTRAADLLRDSKAAVALTGAGISTPSGIPDFRSSRSGLWDRLDPMQVASLLSFRYQPEIFFDHFRELAVLLWRAKPNPAHEALARLERRGYLRGVITQNIDGLHHKAGSTTLEIHGHLRNATCGKCYRSYPAEEYFHLYVSQGIYPTCAQCGSYLKPDVILMGEQLPQAIYRRAETMTSETDLMLIGGSSLEVAPACTLPLQALDHGAVLIIVNNEPTYLDARAEVVVRADVADVFPALANEVIDGG